MTLTADTIAALRAADWCWLRTIVRERLETNSSAATVPIDVDQLTLGERRVLVWLLGWPTTKSGVTRVSITRLEAALGTKVTSGEGLRETLEALGGPLDDRRARRHGELQDKLDANRVILAELRELTKAIPEMTGENAALTSVSPATVLRVPTGSAAGTDKWSVYEAAIRTACEWWRLHATSKPIAAKELAGKALGNTKAWTLRRQQAFANLVHRPFDRAVTTTDTEVRLRGPLTWIVDQVIADAAACRPWLSLPALGVQTLGYTDCAARGVLLVENSEVLEQVCTRTGVPDRWLVIWGSGYASDGLVNLLRTLNLPIAAWGDLDADGIEIITNLAERVGPPVTPVGMSVSLWHAGVKRTQTAGQLDRAKAKAAALATTGTPELRELAAAIAETGESTEQETLYDDVLPHLEETLRGLEIDRRPMGTTGWPVSPTA